MDYFIFGAFRVFYNILSTTEKIKNNEISQFRNMDIAA